MHLVIAITGPSRKSRIRGASDVWHRKAVSLWDDHFILQVLEAPHSIVPRRTARAAACGERVPLIRVTAGSLHSKGSISRHASDHWNVGVVGVRSMVSAESGTINTAQLA